MSRERRRERALRPSRGRARKRRLRIVYVTVVASVALVAGWLTVRPLISGGSGQNQTEVLRVRVNMGGFQPSLLTIKAGQPIRLRVESLDTRFHSDGGGRHQFAIDELGIDVVAPPLGTAETTFTVSEAGIYRFYCSICCGGKANPAMWGTLVVES